MRAQNTLPLKSRLLDGADRRSVLGCRLGVDALQTELERRPLRGDSKSA
jgi:hypothetical protein